MTIPVLDFITVPAPNSPDQAARLSDVSSKITRNSINTASGIAANTVVSISEYVVGRNQILLFLNGALCNPGAANQYEEIGAPDTTSTQIRIGFVVKPGADLTYIIFY
jgi:hypothetical protein